MTSAVAAARSVPSGAAAALPEAPERDLVVRACTACHAPEVVIAKRHSAEEWDEIVAKMVDRGAVASEEEQQQILEYLVRYFGRDTKLKQG
jgi:cytochrome c5